jgi:hypothetical protein
LTNTCSVIGCSELMRVGIVSRDAVPRDASTNGL